MGGQSGRRGLPRLSRRMLGAWRAPRVHRLRPRQLRTEERPQAIQLVQPKEAEDEIAELERQYRETVERENK